MVMRSALQRNAHVLIHTMALAAKRIAPTTLLKETVMTMSGFQAGALQRAPRNTRTKIMAASCTQAAGVVR